MTTRLAGACRIAACLVLCLAFSSCGSTKTPTGPTLADVSGTWSGISTYPNAPFQLTLTQTGTTLTGRYADRYDSSVGVTGTYASRTIHVSVNFGDGGLTIDGQLTDARTSQGTIRSPQLGNNTYSYSMTR